MKVRSCSRLAYRTAPRGDANYYFRRDPDRVLQSGHDLVRAPEAGARHRPLFR